MKYLQLAERGENQWWRYLLALLLIAFMWQVIGGIPMVLLVYTVMNDGDPATYFNAETIRFAGVDPLISYLALSFSFIGLLLGLYLALRFLHRRAFLSLITPLARLSWQRFFTGFGVYFGLLIGMVLAGFLLSPGSFTLNFEAKSFFLFLPLLLLLTPLQACTEEFVFRGYIMQGLGRLSQSRFFVVLGSSVLFMLPHLMNPEVAIDPVMIPLVYLTLGAFLAIITLRDNRLELALGVHTANNLFAFALFNYENSVLASPSVFQAPQPEPVISLVSVIIIACLFYWLVFGVLERRRLRYG